MRKRTVMLVIMTLSCFALISCGKKKLPSSDDYPVDVIDETGMDDSAHDYLYADDPILAEEVTGVPEEETDDTIAETEDNGSRDEEIGNKEEESSGKIVVIGRENGESTEIDAGGAQVDIGPAED